MSDSKYTIIIRHDTSTNWMINNPVLALGEYGVEDDTHRLKRGDGKLHWAELLYENFGLKSIAAVTVDASNHLIVTYTDSTVVDAGEITFIPNVMDVLVNGNSVVDTEGLANINIPDSPTKSQVADDIALNAAADRQYTDEQIRLNITDVLGGEY